jgi:beta-glucosidase
MRRLTAAIMATIALSGCGSKLALIGSQDRLGAMASTTAKVPAGFMWGVSTAGYQWEGFNRTSQWLNFELGGHTEEKAGDAADGAHRFAEDAKLARDMGLNTFRTSIEWSKIEPREGQIDQQAIAYYHDLFRTLRANGLTPVVTLMHFSYPQWVEDKGGWENRDSVNYFAKYVDLVSKEFASDVDWWLTFNEPTVFIGGGYITGQTAPGKRDPIRAIQVAIHMIQAHKKAYNLIHTNDAAAHVSFNNYSASYELGGSQSVRNEHPDTDPDVNGDWLMDSMRAAQERKTGIFGKGYLDYIAIDYYCKWRIGMGFKFKPAWEWEVYPEGFYNSLKNYHTWTGLPVLVAENGFATQNLKPRADGWTREKYMTAHIQQMQRAIADGIPVLGYVHWSITDNYEWGSYSPRFGLYSVDCRNHDFRRVPTTAVSVYRDVVANGGVTASLAHRYPAPGSVHAAVL